MNTQLSAICIANTQIREINGLYSLSDLHKASGGQSKHKPPFWLRNQQTIDLIEKLTELQICNLEQNQELSEAAKQVLLEDTDSLRENVVKVINGGLNQGTYVCKELVVHYGMWISPEFSIKVINTFLNSQTPKAIAPAQSAALPHNPYTFSEEDAQVLDMPLIQYVNKLIGYYCKHKGVSHAVIEKQLVTQFGHGNKDLRLQSKRCHLAAVTWLHEQLDKLPKVNFAVSREDLLHISRQQCEYKKMFEGWNEDQLQRWLDVTFFSDSPRVLNYPRKLDNASYGQLEKLVGAMKAVLGDSFQLLAQECEPRRELSVSADLLVKVSDKLLKFQEFAECVETMAESLGYFMKDGNWRMVDCQLRCLSSLAYQALNENASTLADDLDGLLTA